MNSGPFEAKAAASIQRHVARQREGPAKEHSARHSNLVRRVEVTAGHAINSISVETRQFVAGLFDGDGCITFQSLRQSNICIKTAVTQSHSGGHPPELEFLQKLLGGNIYLSHSPRNEDQRPSWQWHSAKLEVVVALLGIVRDYGIVKAPQASLALDFVFNRRSGHEAWLLCARSKDQYATIDIPERNITVPYLAGLFAAEGCARIHRSIAVYISQKVCPRLLGVIAKKHGGSNDVDLGRWAAFGTTAKKFLGDIRDHLRGQKRPQVDAVLEYEQAREFTPIQEKKRLRKKYREKLKALKKQ